MIPLDFERVVVIAMGRRRPERLARFWRELPEPWPCRTPLSVAAVDGQCVVPPAWYAAQPFGPIEDVTIRQPNSNETLRGAWGCLRSHHRVWEDALNDGLDSVLVLEDDAVCAAHFPRRLQTFLTHVPDDWGQLYLGGQHTERPAAVNEHCLACRNTRRTHAYAMRRPMLGAAYRRLMCVIESHDEHCYHVDYQLAEMQRCRRWKTYAPPEWLVGQAAGASDVMSTHRATPVQWWNDFEVAHV